MHLNNSQKPAYAIVTETSKQSITFVKMAKQWSSWVKLNHALDYLAIRLVTLTLVQ